MPSFDVDHSTLNLTWITEQLAVGGSFGACLVPQLAVGHRVRHVVDLRLEARDDEGLLRDHGLSLLHLPTADHQPIALDLLEIGSTFCAACMAHGERVYVHCEHGIGRSVLLASCVLVQQGEAPLVALWRVKQRRACASPSVAQLHRLLDWSAHCGQRCLPSWEDLAHIAYQQAAPSPVMTERPVECSHDRIR